MNDLYKPCKRCQGTGKLKIRESYLRTKDTKKMLALMDKYGFTQLSLAKTLGISQGTVNGWFHRKTNLQGKIKPLYFENLKNKGYK
jgi:methylphosphotriester-DNA--protein-cysteine methyltransferase